MAKSFEIKSPRKLIESALPLDRINEASLKEKSIRHGHPSTLHLWWARRPLAAARAVLFSQLVNDPGFERNLNRGLNKKEAARERDRLFKIIEKLVLWENTTNESVLNEARDEIRKSWVETCELNKDHPQAQTLFNPEKIPAFHDPFAGGGAIPLEAQRLGLNSYASDLNPVAVLINKAMIEIPPRFAGLRPVNPEASSDKRLIDRDWYGSQGLAEDVRYYGKWIRDESEKRIGSLYPKVEITSEMTSELSSLKQYEGQKLTVIAWIWARTVKSPNPAFSNIDVPLVSTFMLSTKQGKEAYVEPILQNDSYNFKVRMGLPENIELAKSGTKLARSNFKCLMSGVPISGEYIKAEGVEGRIGNRLMAMVAEGNRGRVYLSPTPEMEAIARTAKPTWKPDGEIAARMTGGNCTPYGLTSWGDLFTPRQLVSLNTFSEMISEVQKKVIDDALNAGMTEDNISIASSGSGTKAYAEAISVYLAISINKSADRGSTICGWDNTRDSIRNTFGRQAIPMTWDFVESNILSESTGSFINSVDQTVKTIQFLSSSNNGFATQADAQTQELSKDRIISTDPPYYDNIGYADLSDFFYVWLRRSLKSIYSDLFATLSVPKAEELVATSFRHGGKEKAEIFFLDGMTQAMHRLAIQSHPAFPVTIYYAFKQTKNDSENNTTNTGWDTFLAAIIEAGFAITGTWPMRTELGNRMIGSGTNALASSIILVCRKRASSAPSITRRDFIRELKQELSTALEVMIGGVENVSPVAPVDLAQAIIGPGMAVFSKYSAVLEADGSKMSVREALSLINRSIAESSGDFDADTQFCLDWFNQHAWNSDAFGSADVLARAKGTSVEHVRAAGVIDASAGKVRLLKPSEYDGEWDPKKDNNIPSWELLHRLSNKMEQGGIEIAGALLARVDVRRIPTEGVRKLAYQLYTVCERAGKSEDARRYNNLIVAWDSITQYAETKGRAGTQVSLGI